MASLITLFALLSLSISLAQGGWNNWNNWEGEVGSDPSAGARYVDGQPSEPHVFYTTPSGQVQHQFASADGTHGPIESIPISCHSAPGTAFPHNGDIALTCVTAASEVILSTHTANTWSAPTTILTDMQYSPSMAVWGADNIIAAATGIDHRVYVFDLSLGVSFPLGDANDAHFISPPVAVAARDASTELVFILARDASSDLQYTFLRAGVWSGTWTSLNVTVRSEPSVNERTFGFDISVLGIDSNPLVRSYNLAGGWGSWIDLGGFAIGRPCPVANDDGMMYVFVRSGKANVLAYKYKATSDAKWSGWQARKGEFWFNPMSTWRQHRYLDVWVSTQKLQMYYANLKFEFREFH